MKNEEKQETDIYPNWKKKEKAEFVEFSEVKSERETNLLPLPNPNEMRKLENELKNLDRQEVKLQGKLDSLEQFLFKEKQHEWGEKRRRGPYSDLETPSVASVREMMTVSSKGIY